MTAFGVNNIDLLERVLSAIDLYLQEIRKKPNKWVSALCILKKCIFISLLYYLMDVVPIFVWVSFSFLDHLLKFALNACWNCLASNCGTDPQRKRNDLPPVVSCAIFLFILLPFSSCVKLKSHPPLRKRSWTTEHVGRGYFKVKKKKSLLIDQENLLHTTMFST